jgi:hypothetical protein
MYSQSLNIQQIKSHLQSIQKTFTHPLERQRIGLEFIKQQDPHNAIYWHSLGASWQYTSFLMQVLNLDYAAAIAESRKTVLHDLGKLGEDMEPGIKFVTNRRVAFRINHTRRSGDFLTALGFDERSAEHTYGTRHHGETKEMENGVYTQTFQNEEDNVQRFAVGDIVSALTTEHGRGYRGHAFALPAVRQVLSTDMQMFSPWIRSEIQTYLSMDRIQPDPDDAHLEKFKDHLFYDYKDIYTIQSPQFTAQQAA